MIINYNCIDCGHSFTVRADTVDLNGVKYCCFCGGGNAMRSVMRNEWERIGKVLD